MAYRRSSTPIGILAGLAALALSSGAPMAQEPVALTIVVPNPSALNNFPLHNAIGEGYFEQEGLTVTVEAVNGSASVLQALASGQAQIGNPGPGPVLAARERGEEIVFIYNQYPNSIFGLVVPEESPIKGPAELKDQTIGVGTADGAEVGFTRAIMAASGLMENKGYQFLSIGDGGTAAAAILGKEVAAYAAAASDAAIIQARGIPLREITPSGFLSYFGNGWAVTQAYLDENESVIERFGRALVKGTRFGLDPANNEKTLAHAAAANPQEGEDTALATLLLEAAQTRINPQEQMRGNGYGFQPPEHWQLWHEAQVETGALKAPLADLTAAYTNKFVAGWNAE